MANDAVKIVSAVAEPIIGKRLSECGYRIFLTNEDGITAAFELNAQVVAQFVISINRAGYQVLARFPDALRGRGEEYGA